MGRNRKGSGRVFQRTYRDAKGKLRKTKNWYIEFVAGNRTSREATDFTNRTDAAEFLKKRMSDALRGKIVLSRNVAYGDPRDLIITEDRGEVDSRCRFRTRGTLDQHGSPDISSGSRSRSHNSRTRATKELRSLAGIESRTMEERRILGVICLV
jgi:hypothetical protein